MEVIVEEDYNARTEKEDGRVRKDGEEGRRKLKG